MNPDLPLTPREELEIKITALLMGQLSPEEAEALQAQIAADPELTALHAQLRHAAELLRASRALPEPTGAGDLLQLSKERREKLLATFRGIKALPSPVPSAAPPVPSRPVVKQRRERNWTGPVILAASIAVLLGAGMVLLPSLGTYSKKAALAKFLEEKSAEPFDGLRDEAAPTRAYLATAKPAPPELVGYRAGGGGMSDPKGGQSAPSDSWHWSSQSGRMRGGGVAGERPLSESLATAGKVTTTPLNPAAGSGQQVPVIVAENAWADTASLSGGIYLPSITREEGRKSGVAGAVPTNESKALAITSSSDFGLEPSEHLRLKPPAGGEYQRFPAPAGPPAAPAARPADTAARGFAFTTAEKGKEDARTGRRDVQFGNEWRKDSLSAVAGDGGVLQGQNKQLAKSKSDAEDVTKLTELRAGVQAPGATPTTGAAAVPGAAPVTAGNRSGEVTTAGNAIDALLFAPFGPATAPATPPAAAEPASGPKIAARSLDDGRDYVIPPAQTHYDADNFAVVAPQAAEAAAADREKRGGGRAQSMPKVEGFWAPRAEFDQSGQGRSLERFDQPLGELSKTRKTVEDLEKTVAQENKLQAQARDNRSLGSQPLGRTGAPSAYSWTEDETSKLSVATNAEGTFWDVPNVPNVAEAAKPNSGLSSFRGGLGYDANGLGGFGATGGGQPAVARNGATVLADGTMGDFDRGISKHIDGPMINKPDEGHLRIEQDGLRYYVIPQDGRR